MRLTGQPRTWMLEFWLLPGLSLRNKRQVSVQPPKPPLEVLLPTLCLIRAGNTTQNTMDDFTSTLILAWLPCSELTLCELDTMCAKHTTWPPTNLQMTIPQERCCPLTVLDMDLKELRWLALGYWTPINRQHAHTHTQTEGYTVQRRCKQAKHARKQKLAAFFCDEPKASRHL